MSRRDRYSQKTLRCPHRQLPERPPELAGMYGYEPEYRAWKEANPDPPAGYCDDCWQAALLRPFTPEEWEELHRQARQGFNGPGNVWQPIRPYTLPPAPKPGKAKTWEQIAATIGPGDRPTVTKAWIGSQAGAWHVRATDGRQLIATRDQGGGKDAERAMGGLIEPADPTWIDLPLGFDLAVKRVALLAGRNKAITVTHMGPVLEVRACGYEEAHYLSHGRENWAREIVTVGLVACPARSVTLHAPYLLAVLGGDQLQLALRDAVTPVVIRPRLDHWRYVLMGMRE